MSALSQMAPAAVLPILAPDAVVSSGEVERVELRRPDAAAEIDARDDIAPLIGAAHLQQRAVAPVDLDEVIGLQAHVVELDEGEFLLAFEPQLHRIHRQHAIDREVAADVAQEVDVVEAAQPFGVVEHQRVGRAVAEGEEAFEDGPDRRLVGVDLLDGQKLAALVLAGRIADPRRAAADQRQRLAAGALQPGEHHDRQQRCRHGARAPCSRSRYRRRASPERAFSSSPSKSEH